MQNEYFGLGLEHGEESVVRFHPQGLEHPNEGEVVVDDTLPPNWPVRRFLNACS